MAKFKCPYCGAGNAAGSVRCRICTAMIGAAANASSSSMPSLAPVSAPLPAADEAPAGIESAPAFASTPPSPPPPPVLPLPGEANGDGRPLEGLDVFGHRTVAVQRQPRTVQVGRVLGVGAAVVVLGSVLAFVISG